MNIVAMHNEKLIDDKTYHLFDDEDITLIQQFEDKPNVDPS